MRALLFLAILIPAYASALDAPEIIRRSVIANNEDWKAFPRYTHRETDIHSKIDARGEPISKTSRTYQVLMIDGSPYEKTITVNGTALSADQQKREEAKLRAEITRRQRESSEQRQARIAKYRGERQSDQFLMNEMIHAFQFKLVGEDQKRRVPMRFEKFSFGSIRIDGVTHEHDVVIDSGRVHKRKKKPSKKFRDAFGHTPLSVEEKIPSECRRLVIGTGTGALPVMKEVKREAQRRKIKLLILPTVEAIKELKQNLDQTNAILHVTC